MRHLLLAATAISFATPAWAEDPPPLTKKSARRRSRSFRIFAPA